MKFVFLCQLLLLKWIEKLMLIDEKSNDFSLPKFISFFEAIDAFFRAIL